MRYDWIRITSVEGPSWDVRPDQEIGVYISDDYVVGIPASRLLDKDGFRACTRDLEPGPGMKMTTIASVAWVR